MNKGTVEVIIVIGGIAAMIYLLTQLEKSAPSGPSVGGSVGQLFTDIGNFFSGSSDSDPIASDPDSPI
jgi:hypothetical protein